MLGPAIVLGTVKGIYHNKRVDNNCLHTIHESKYTAIKLQRNGNSRPWRKKLTKNNSVSTTSQAQLTGWMPLMIFTQIIHL